ncbi:MBL fold metallo-hydrolase [Geobacter sulfurreducens]|uniref:Metal-dependent hydrolase, beta-lactamase superfamily n=1 Tax=Geobacter sulfurreducens (strain ATCC 51573 / DSM 12127 / PCA) TaxID=243231 RepID=Q747Z3_GEOSL|nr:MBL fold metallo-hydrolase [Geobacter sulfurreducens]AAR36513.2 metal-dependent hydrolase, beta-lactamase superfamily [Geobacter sulfurreducens PCA]AJY69361.1 hydrolase [Geobacter sulfurreducens]QVW34916.1 MBL fold metallo-hydrolase [Geobacter sulfurreducens]UAC03787.1 MBL fold metallo-hydrolase [Geobacter sulfurreducens]HBB70967.1 hydrolase [Geobacter sulfurreducens]
MKRIILYTLIAGVVIVMASTLFNKTSSARTRSSLSLASDLKRPVEVTTGGPLELARVMWDFFFNKPADTRPSGKIPVQTVIGAQLMSAPNNTVYRLGHSTVLMKLNDAFWITDPMFSDRASPVRFAGPERFHPPPISIDELPPIRAVIISHDHYDHLDHDSIMKLAGKTEYFLTPLGVGDILADWGVPAAKVRQLDWWQGIDVGGVRFVATPAQHFSGRGFFGKNLTQWASWVILAPGRRLFFSGDTGYFDGFKQIGDQYGPFDLTLLEAGAYNARWPNVHMHPEESIQAHLDLKGKSLLPIHNGTFDLSMHPWREPFDRIAALGIARGIPVLTPLMGEPVSMDEATGGLRWLQLKPERQKRLNPARGSRV